MFEPILMDFLTHFKCRKVTKTESRIYYCGGGGGIQGMENILRVGWQNFLGAWGGQTF